MEDASGMADHYLDLETGQVIMITDETRWELEEIYQEFYDPETKEPVDLAEVLRQSDLPDWRKEALLEAERVEAEYGSRYVSVPQGESHQGYRDMEDFIFTVRDERLQDRLRRAISGRGAFRYFKDVLYDYPRERERWFAFQDERTTERVREWLESEGIEPIIEPQPAMEFEPELPPVRSRLIAEALAFVGAVRDLPGVTRIALIGSLTTDEPDPKDVDLLVTITEKVNLSRLAKLARKLQGHAQSFNRGGEVFLADPQGNYLGRTCPWKQCGPGIRASCDALHCGRRLYLHDDLATIRLAKSLVAAPPLELWPQIVARVPVPEDIEQELLAPLRA
jgi:predicted nucleotidyltransferase